MFDINGWEWIVLILLAVFLFGPDRLPKVINDAVRFIRTVRTMARNATGELSRELGTEVSLEDLNPKTFVRKHLLSEADEEAIRRPFTEVSADLRGLAGDLESLRASDLRPGGPYPPAAAGTSNSPAAPQGPRGFDPDAT